MATKTTVTLTCDFDGKPADETVTVTLDGEEWEAEVCPETRETLATALAPFTAAARRVSRHPSRSLAGRRNTAARRAWAVSQGLLERGSRGRMPQSVTDAYERHLAGSR